MLPPDQGYAWGDQPITRSPMSTGYRLGLAVVSVMMILLPAIYILLCVGMGYGIYYYATNEYGLLNYHQPGIVAYVGPMVAGCIGLVFMIKPLFARQKKINAYLEITREQQPRLFQFIDEVCAKVGAPKPVRVRLDNQVNASASFEHGWWGVLTRRLVLTIGLPLAQGLTVSQFGGVLAHEFGHFTQSAAMRFSYVIRTINGWFGRVIYERDSFDAQLLARSKRGNYYSIIIANIARGFVWLARKILWLLMRAGHAVSAYLMRQMEFDADHYEQEVAGAKNFRETFVLLQLMNAGAQMTGNHLNQLWKNGKLVTNTALLSQRLVATIPGDAVEKLRADLAENKTAAAWHATHPSDPERIARALNRAETGALIGDPPATTLFDAFDPIAEKLTLIDYKERFNLNVKPEALIRTESYLQDNSARAERVKAMTEFFGGLLDEHRLIFPDKPAGEDALTLEQAWTRFQECADALAQQRSASNALCQKIGALRGRRAQAMAAQMLHGMGVEITPAQFGLENLGPATIEKALADTTTEIDQRRAELKPAVKLTREKLHYYCRIAESPEWAAHVQGDPRGNAELARIITVKSALLAIRPIYELLTVSRKSVFLATVCVENFNAAKNKPWTEREFKAFTDEFRATIMKIEQVGNTLAYPLLDGKTCAHLTGYFLIGNNQEGAVGRFNYLRSIFERYTHLYTELVLELLEKMAAIEKACAPETIA
jgi:Zn-dependent protease with chaperone function